MSRWISTRSSSHRYFPAANNTATTASQSTRTITSSITSGKIIYKINLNNEEDKTVFRCGQDGLGDQPISTIREDKKGNIWFGTHGAGLYLYDRQKNKFKGYTTENSLILSNYCYEIQDSQQGYLIISGDKGLSFFDPEQELFKVVELGTALPLSGINKGCGLPGM